MVGNVGAQVGLLAFAIAVIAGLSAGNAPVTILTRALVGMFAAALVAQVVAWAARSVLREHLQSRKVKIDHDHYQALRTEDEGADLSGTP
jgi:hypothetical protein